MAFTLITGGSFTSTAIGVKINLPTSADYFRITNISQMANATATDCVRGEWYGAKFGAGATAANDGLRWRKAGSSAILIDTFATSTATNGFTYVTSTPVVEAQNANAITAITNASPAVVTQTNTYSDGDVLQFYGTTGMLQISGMNFQISSSSGAGYTLTGLRAAGFAFAGTAGFTRRISPLNAVEPEFLFITEITKATQAVVRTSVDPTLHYVVGMLIHFSVPYSFGMTQINGLTGKIVAVSSTNYTLTVDIDTTNFTTFAFPTSASSPVSPLFATLAPAGARTQQDPNTLVQTGYDFTKQPFRTGQFVPYMFIGGGGAGNATGTSGNVINWEAYKFEN